MGVPFLKFPILFGAGAAILLAMAGCGHSAGTGGSSSAVAQVGKDSITEKEFFDYLQRKPSFIARVQNQDVPVPIVDSPGYQALKDLVVNKVVLQLAKEQSVYPDDKAVTTELEFQQGQSPQLINVALSKGLSLDDLKGEFRLELAKFNLQTKGLTETLPEASQYMKEHPKEFMDPPMVQAQVLFARKADMKAVDERLASGAPFETAAQQVHTIDKNAEKNNFRYQTTNVSQMPKPIQALFAKTGELATTTWQPLDTKGTVSFKFYVQKKIDSKPTTVTPTLTPNGSDERYC